MGRVPGTDGTSGASPNKVPGKARSPPGTPPSPGHGAEAQPLPERTRPALTLAERLEEWRDDPDMCLIWAAFCTSSALQLSDGLHLAKARRSSVEVLDILTGRHSSCTDGSTTTYKGVVKSAVPNKPACPNDGRDDDDASTLAPTSVPASPALGPSPAPAGLGQASAGRGRLDSEDSVYKGPMTMRSLWKDSSAPPPNPRRARAQADLGGGCATPPQGLTVAFREPSKFSLGAPEGCLGGEQPEPELSWSLTHGWDASEAGFLPWSLSPFADCVFGRAFATSSSSNSEVRLLEFRKESSSSSSSSCACLGGGDFAVVAKIVPVTTVENCIRRDNNEHRAWLADGEVSPLEDIRNEVAVLSLLQRLEPNVPSDRGPFFVELLGAFRDDNSFLMVTEFCEGGDVFERVARGAPVGEATKRRYVAQILQAVQFLHGRNIGHRDISLENVLLRHGDECALVDFAQAVPLRGADGVPLRYFAEAGKRVYRAPEMYVPRQQMVQVVCPSGASPGATVQISYDKCRCEVRLPADAVPGRPCVAETCGYAAAPADVFACGVCAFVLTVGKLPWAVTRDCDPTFSFMRRHGVATLLKQWRVSGGPEVEALLAQMLHTEPSRRSLAEGCLRSPWLMQ